MSFEKYITLNLVRYCSPYVYCFIYVLTRREFFIFSILNPFSFAKVISMNRSVTLLSNSTFTTTPSWFSSFSSPTFIQTSLKGCSVHHTSLTLLVVLVKFNLLPSFSGYNILYRLLEASRELIVLHFLLPTLAAFLLSSSYVSSNNFWSYGPTFHIHSTFCLLLFSYLCPFHLGLSLDLFDFFLC